MALFKNHFGRKFAVQDARIGGLKDGLTHVQVTVDRLEDTVERIDDKLIDLTARFTAFPTDVALHIQEAIDARRKETEGNFVPKAVCQTMHHDIDRRVDRIETLAEKRERER
jgi:uncharacterized coiled-coil protein SlyX